MIQPNTIIISRTDSIGDVMLTLPITGILKKNFPEIKIIFLAKSYTLPVLRCCSHIDEIANWSDFENKSDVLLVVSKENYRKCQVTYRLRLQTVLHVLKNSSVYFVLRKRPSISSV